MSLIARQIPTANQKNSTIVAKLRKQEDDVESLKNEIRDIRTKQQDKLEKIAKLTKKDAADKLMQMTERDIKQDLLGGQQTAKRRDARC